MVQGSLQAFYNIHANHGPKDSLCNLAVFGIPVAAAWGKTPQSFTGLCP
jgi:hypothetical protein